jgi:hypothetical protein
VRKRATETAHSRGYGHAIAKQRELRSSWTVPMTNKVCSGWTMSSCGLRHVPFLSLYVHLHLHPQLPPTPHAVRYHHNAWGLLPRGTYIRKLDLRLAGRCNAQYSHTTSSRLASFPTPDSVPARCTHTKSQKPRRGNSSLSVGCAFGRLAVSS